MEFITYSQALELKKLGFDEPCFGIWMERGNKHDVIYVTKQEDAWMAEQNDGILAPLYQQAFRWFREKYNLLGIVGYCDDNSGKFMSVIDKINSDIDYDMNAKDTYEEAELACLNRLIEIVKNKP